MDLCEFEASLVYRASSRTGYKATKKYCFQKPNPKQNQQKVKVCALLENTVCSEHNQAGKDGVDGH